MQRDPIGDSAIPPNSNWPGHARLPNWPGHARLAVNFVLNFGKGSEPSVSDGDAASEWALTEEPG